MDEHGENLDDGHREEESASMIDRDSEGVADVDAEPAQMPDFVPDPTGHAGVDEVLGDLRSLSADAPAEHVAVFERAHETLRSALADAQRAGSDSSEGR